MALEIVRPPITFNIDLDRPCWNCSEIKVETEIIQANITTIESKVHTFSIGIRTCEAHRDQLLKFLIGHQTKGSDLKVADSIRLNSQYWYFPYYIDRWCYIERHEKIGESPVADHLTYSREISMSLAISANYNDIADVDNGDSDFDSEFD
jgi:hypothetical protein